jgi:hypothetical protein
MHSRSGFKAYYKTRKGVRIALYKARKWRCHKENGVTTAARAKATKQNHENSKPHMA